MVGMGGKRRTNPWLIALAIALASFAFLCIPVALIGCAILESALFRTRVLFELAFLSGTYDAFEKLYLALKPVLGW